MDDTGTSLGTRQDSKGTSRWITNARHEIAQARHGGSQAHMQQMRQARLEDSSGTSRLVPGCAPYKPAATAPGSSIRSVSTGEHVGNSVGNSIG
eukprot:2077703-Rhodomonas_salina.6